MRQEPIVLRDDVRQLGVAVLCALAVLTGCGTGGPTRHPSVQQPASCRGSSAGGLLEPRDGSVYFGVNLDWGHDSPTSLARRLGRRPALYVAFASFPLEGSGAGFIDAIVSGLKGQPAALMLTLEPNGGLSMVTDASVAGLAKRVASYNREGVPIFLRFAHEMNGSWYPWSQQPAAYISAFRKVAAVIHRSAPATALVWAPNYGGGYPFTGGRYAAARGTPDFKALDTNGDGTLTMADDPYAPYYPGDDAVDWVGMSLYHWGNRYPWGANALPEPGKFAGMLTGQYRGTVGDESAVPDFYDSYANLHHKPVAITETAAFFSPSRPGDEAAIKGAWWKQVFDPSIGSRFPQLQMINWFEWDKYETEVGAEVNWTVTRRRDLATAFAAALPSQLLWAGSVPECASHR
jgi:Glycosyl hydrolase family 26